MTEVQPVRIAADTREDEDVLCLILTYAASMGSRCLKQIEQATSDLYLNTYVKGW